MFGRISFVLATVLLIGGMAAVVHASSMPGAGGPQSTPTASVQTVRAFYVGLNRFLENGEISEVRDLVEPGALAHVPQTGAFGDESALETYLLALRSSWHNLFYEIEHLETAGELVIVDVTARGTPKPFSVLAPEQTSPGRAASTAFFLVRDNRIVRHWSDAAGGLLVHPVIEEPPTIRVQNESHQIFADLTVWPGQEDFSVIPGPGYLAVTSGTLTIIGNGRTEVIDPLNGMRQVTERDKLAHIPAAGVVFVPHGNVAVRNGSQENVTIQVALAVSEPASSSLPEFEADDEPGESISIASALLGPPGQAVVAGPIVVTPGSVGQHPLSPGRWFFELAYGILAPGASAFLTGGGQVAALSGQVTRETVPAANNEPGELLGNSDDEPALLLVARLTPLD
jgi:hypothetical protein